VSASSQLGMRVVRAAYVTDFWGNRERFAGLMFTRNSNLRDLGRGFPRRLPSALTLLSRRRQWPSGQRTGQRVRALARALRSELARGA